MSGLVKPRPQARRDIINLALFISQDSPEAARRFLSEVETTISTIIEMPSLGALREYRHPALRGLRSIAVQRFDKHLIFYRPLTPGIEIVRVLHGARDLDAIFRDM